MAFYGVTERPGTALSATSVKLLQAASEIVGGDRALARHLGIGEAALRKLMSGSQALPDFLLLRAVDIILADRQTRPSPDQPSGQPSADGSPHAD